MTAIAPTYARLMRVHGIPQLMGSALLSRTAAQVWQVATVLFALQHYHSAGVAGLGVFLLIFPGLLLSPVAGALLDRHGRRLLMRVDFTVAAIVLIAIAALGWAGALPVVAFLLLLAAGSLTSTLSIAGARSLFPLLVPAELWDRANAGDALSYGVSQIIGPALAGALTAVAGAPVALVAAAAGYLLAVLALGGLHEPGVRGAGGGRVLGDAAAGIRYVAQSPWLRWLAAASSLANVGFGIVLVVLPVVVFRLHGGAALVGALLALEGAVALPSTLLAGRLRSEGRERQIMALGDAAFGVLTLALLAPSLIVVGAAFALAGAADGPPTVAVFSFRQRRTEPEWFGRVFAVSASLNYAGMPIGSAIAGPLLGISLPATVAVAAVLPMAAAVLTLRAIPAGQPDAAGRLP